MKTLYLVRHAKSDWADLSLKDYDRPLNPRGERTAPRMGARLKKENEIPDLVLSSPAKRTTQTAIALCEQIGIETQQIKYVDSIYEASVRELLNIINSVDNHFSKMMLVCHNMAVSYIAEYLTSDIIDNVPTCGVIKITFDLNDWALISEKTGNQEFFWKPKELEF